MATEFSRETGRPTTKGFRSTMVEYIRGLTKDGIPWGSAPVTMTRKELRDLLLDTDGGEYITIKEKVYRYTYLNKHLGAGVYKVWLKL